MGAAVLLLMLPVLLIQLQKNPNRKTDCLMLILLSAAAALLCCFFSAERSMAAVFPLQNRQISFTAQVLEWDVTDYGSKYLVKTAENEEVPNGLRARVYSYEEPAAEIGDMIKCRATVRQDLKSYDLGRNIFFYAFAGEQPISLLREETTLREQMMNATEELYQPPVLGMVQGILFGEKKNLEQPFAQMMSDSGLVHLLAVSGIHIMLLASFCVKLFSSFKIPVFRARLLALLPVWGYVALAQFSPSAVRAGIMATVYALGFCLGRDNDSLTALCAAAIVLLAFSPFCFYSVSFQLSFAVTLGIVVCAKPFARLLCSSTPIALLMGKVKGKQEKCLTSVCSSIATAFAASVFSAPLLLFYFHSVPLWSILAGLLALWAAAPLMILAMLSIAFFFLAELPYASFLLFAARAAAFLAGILARWILLVSKGISALPFSTVYSHEIPLLLACCAAAVLALLFARRFFRLSVLQQKMRGTCFFSGATLCICTTLIAVQLMNRGVLNIFSTENALILCKDGQAAVVGDVKTEYEAQEISSVLQCEKADSLELFLCDSDTTKNSAGLDMLLDDYPVKVAAVEAKGALYPHIQKAVGEGKLVSPQGICAKMMGGITLQSGENGIEMTAAGKKMLKAAQDYDIIEGSEDGYDAVWKDGESTVKPCAEMGLFASLREQPVFKLRMDGKEESHDF